MKSRRETPEKRGKVHLDGLLLQISGSVITFDCKKVQINEVDTGGTTCLSLLVFHCIDSNFS